MMTTVTPTPRSTRLWAILALSVIPISGLSIDIYVPSLPAISSYFACNKALVQLTITTYIFGLGIMQLFAGNISDSIGRKKPYIVSMVLYVITAFLITRVTSIEQLLWLRFIQGITVACLSVTMRAVISDLYQGPELYKMVNYMTLAWALGPVVAPAIGGYLQHYYGWHAPFYFLTFYGLIMLVLNGWLLPETLKHTKPLHLKRMLHHYQELLTHRVYVLGLLCLGFLYSLLALFGLVAPFFIQTVLGYSSISFGHMALLMGLAWFLGNMTNRLLWHFTPQQKVKICFWLMLVVSLFMLVLAQEFPTAIVAFIIPNFILLYLAGMIFPNYFAQSMALFPHIAATANALMGAFMVFIASACTGLGSLLKTNNSEPLVITYIAIIILALIAYYATGKAFSTPSHSGKLIQPIE